MGADLGDIFVTLGLDASSLRKGLDEAVSNVKQSAGQIGDAFKGIAGSIDAGAQAIVDGFDKASNAGQAFQKNLQDNLQQLGLDFRTVGMDLTAAVTVPLTAMAAAAVAASLDITAAMNTLRQTTDGLGPELESLKHSFNDVFATVPAKAADVSAALAMINDRLHVTGDDATAVATQFLNLARVTGEQVVPLITAGTRAAAEWGISFEQLGGKMDYVRNVANDTGIKVGTLLQHLVTFGPTLKELGFDFDHAAGLIAKFDQEGVNTTRALTGMGLALRNLSKAGIEDPVAGLQLLINKIKEAGSAGEANAIGIKVFGRSATDIVLAIREGKLSIDDFVASMQRSTDTINKAAGDTVTLAQKWQLFKNQMEQALGPLGDAIGKIAAQIMEAAAPIIEWIGKIAKAFADLPEPAQIAILAIAGLAAAIGPALLALGLFMQGLSALIPIIATATAALGLGVGLTGIMMGLIGAVTLAAGAFAGWELGTWARNALGPVAMLGDAIGSLLLKVPGLQAVMDHLNGTTAAAAANQKMLADAVTQLETKLRAQGVTVDKTGLSLEQYALKLRAAAADMGKANATVDAGTKSNTQSATAMLAALDKLVYGMDKADKAFKSHAISMAEMSVAGALAVETYKKMGQEQKNILDSIIKVNEGQQKYLDIDKQIADYTAGITSSISGEAAMWLTLKTNVEDVNSAFNANMRVMNETSGAQKKWFDGLMDILDRLPGGVKQLQQAVVDTDREFSELGIKFKTSVEAQITSFNDLMSKGLLTSKQALIAEKSILLQEIQDQKDAGTAISQAYLDRLHIVEKELTKFGDSPLWKEIHAEAVRLTNDLTDGFARALLSGKNFFQSMGQLARKLGEDLFSFVFKTWMQISGIQKQIEDSLAKMINTLFGKTVNVAGDIVTKAGGGAAAQAAGGATGMAGGAAGGGGGASGLFSGLSGMLNVVTGIISSISNIIQNFQLAHMNTNIGRIEVSTRRLDIVTEQNYPIFTTLFHKIADATQSTSDMVKIMGDQLQKLADAIRESIGTSSAEGVFGALTRVAASILDLIAAFSSTASPTDTGGAPGSPTGPKPGLTPQVDLQLAAIKDISSTVVQLGKDVVKAIQDGVMNLNSSLAALGTGMAYGSALTAVAAAGSSGGSSTAFSIGNLNISDPNVIRIGQSLIAALQARGLKSY